MASRRSPQPLNEMSPHILQASNEAVSENTSLDNQSMINFDSEIYWEMNYHEAAIFLEVEFFYLT